MGLLAPQIATQGTDHWGQLPHDSSHLVVAVDNLNLRDV